MPATTRVALPMPPPVREKLPMDALPFGPVTLTALAFPALVGPDALRAPRVCMPTGLSAPPPLPVPERPRPRPDAGRATALGAGAAGAAAVAGAANAGAAGAAGAELPRRLSSPEG